MRTKIIIILIIVIVVLGTMLVIQHRKPIIVSTIPTALPSATEFKESGDDTNGEHIGYIKSIAQNNGGYSMTIDYVQWTACTDCMDDYTVSNTNTKLRTFPIASTATIQLQTYSHNNTDGNFDWNQLVSLPDFVNIETHPTNDYTVSRLLYWITIKNGTITSITEQYQP